MISYDIFSFHHFLWLSRNPFRKLDCDSVLINTCLCTFEFKMGTKYVIFLYGAALGKFCRCAKLFLIFCNFLEQIIDFKKMKVRFSTVVNAEYLVILFFGIFYLTSLNLFFLFFSATHNLFLLFFDFYHFDLFIFDLLHFDLFLFDLLHFDLFVKLDLLLLIIHIKMHDDLATFLVLVSIQMMWFNLICDVISTLVLLIAILLLNYILRFGVR